MDSVIRMIGSINPVTDVTSADMSCGNGAAANTATMHAAAKPGSKITFEMRSGNVGALWPHDVGPIMTYMASCGGNSCSDFDSTKAEWFKVGQAGYTDPTATIAKDGAVWEMGITYYKQSPYAMTLPSSLPNGAYLLRMEVRNISLFGRGSQADPDRLEHRPSSRPSVRRSRVLPFLLSAPHLGWIRVSALQHRRLPRRVQGR